MNLADLTLNALKGFAQEVSTWTNSGVLHSIEGHIAQIESAVTTDVHAGENAAKAVWADLYGAFHGQDVTPVSPDQPAPAPTVVESNTPAAPSVPTPAAAGSAQATPSTLSESTEAASSAPVSAEAPTVVGEPGPELTPPAEPTA